MTLPLPLHTRVLSSTPHCIWQRCSACLAHVRGRQGSCAAALWRQLLFFRYVVCITFLRPSQCQHDALLHGSRFEGVGGTREREREGGRQKQTAQSTPSAALQVTATNSPPLCFPTAKIQWNCRVHSLFPCPSPLPFLGTRSTALQTIAIAGFRIVEVRISTGHTRNKILSAASPFYLSRFPLYVLELCCERRPEWFKGGLVVGEVCRSGNARLHPLCKPRALCMRPQLNTFFIFFF